MMVRAIDHKGFSVLQIISPCVTFHNIFEETKAGVHDMPKEHNPKDKAAAIKLALEGTGMEMGLFYEEQRPTLEDGLAFQKQKAKGAPPARKSDMSDLILKVARPESLVFKPQ